MTCERYLFQIVQGLSAPLVHARLPQPQDHEREQHNRNDNDDNELGQREAGARFGMHSHHLSQSCSSLNSQFGCIARFQISGDIVALTARALPSASATSMLPRQKLWAKALWEQSTLVGEGSS